MEYSHAIMYHALAPPLPTADGSYEHLIILKPVSKSFNPRAAAATNKLYRQLGGGADGFPVKIYWISPAKYTSLAGRRTLSKGRVRRAGGRWVFDTFVVLESVKAAAELDRCPTM